MRVYQVLGQRPDVSPTLEHVDDCPEGGCFVQCICGAVFNEKNLEHCPNCGKDLIFPNADW